MSDNMIHDTSVEDSTSGESAAPVDGDTPPDVDTGDGGDERGNPSREAAKYRRQLRDVKAQRDQLGERLATMQRSQVETLAREHLADGADIWRDGIELAALLDDDGNLDPAKVTDAAQATAKAHRHWAAPRPQKRNPIATSGFRSGTSGYDSHVPAAPSWQQVINNRMGSD